MQEIPLKRKIYTELQKWKKEYAPEYALFIKGARRVGKTTIAEEFGKNEYYKIDLKNQFIIFT